jgi:hypothetical protein
MQPSQLLAYGQCPDDFFAFSPVYENGTPVSSDPAWFASNADGLLRGAGDEMSLHSKIATFLRLRIETPYCDDCLLEVVGEATLDEVHEETASMRGQPDFLYGGNTCTRCGDRKPTTMAMTASSMLQA